MITRRRRIHRERTGWALGGVRVGPKSEGMTTSTSPASNSATTRAAANRLTRPDGSPLRALVVDDEPMLQDLLSMALRYDGWEVRSAGSGAGGGRAGRGVSPGGVLLGVLLPGL